MNSFRRELTDISAKTKAMRESSEYNAQIFRMRVCVSMIQNLMHWMFSKHAFVTHYPFLFELQPV